MVVSEKMKKRMHTLLVVEHLCRKMSVEELDSIADGLRKGRTGKRGCEGFKIQLQHEIPIFAA